MEQSAGQPCWCDGDICLDGFTCGISFVIVTAQEPTIHCSFFPLSGETFCFLWLAIAANAREEEVSESDRPKKAGKREQQNQSEERRKHLWL